MSFDTVVKWAGFPMATMGVGLIVILFGGSRGLNGKLDPFVCGFLIILGFFVSLYGVIQRYYYKKRLMAGTKRRRITEAIAILSILLLTSKAVFIFGSDGQIYSKYASIYESLTKTDSGNPPYATPISPPANTTLENGTIEPTKELTSTSTTIEIDKVAIRQVLVQLFTAWNNEVFSDNWDEHMTSAYKARYVGDIFANVDQLAAFFGNSK